jgi:hypothetical protein
MAKWKSSSTDPEHLLDAARNWTDLPKLECFTESVIERLVEAQGIDFATAVLYDRLIRRPDVADLLSRFADHDISDSRRAARGRLALVPGALYREYPQTGADGCEILSEVRRLGWSAELVPLPSDGSPHENGIHLCHWLRQQPRPDLVLVSLSKGGADVKCALALPEAKDAFDCVRGWISFGGILNGAPMVEWVCTRPLARAWYRMVCMLGGHDFTTFTNLGRNPTSPLAFPLSVFPHMNVIHVVGVPLRRHLSSSRARRWHRRLARWGPNDSVTMLSDVIGWPGNVFPVWGTDHYGQERWDARHLVPFLLSAAYGEVQMSARIA